MKGARQLPQKLIRLPLDVKAFVDDQSRRNGSSQNSEIIRCIRERMDRVMGKNIPVAAGEE